MPKFGYNWSYLIGSLEKIEKAIWKWSGDSDFVLYSSKSVQYLFQEEVVLVGIEQVFMVYLFGCLFCYNMLSKVKCVNSFKSQIL